MGSIKFRIIKLIYKSELPRKRGAVQSKTSWQSQEIMATPGLQKSFQLTPRNPSNIYIPLKALGFGAPMMICTQVVAYNNMIVQRRLG